MKNVKGFSLQNWKLSLFDHPMEDGFNFNTNIKSIVVADGVTRDPCEELCDTSTLKGKIEFLKNYPKASPAIASSGILCYAFMQNFGNKNLYSEVEARFRNANELIKDWNEKNMQNPDCLVRDLAGCVGAGAIISDNVVYYGFISDCGIAIYDKNANMRFKTPDLGPGPKDQYFWEDERLKNTDWRNPLARKIIRSAYRNNPLEEHSYGVLTGEESAMEYINLGSNEVKEGEHLIVFSDGIEGILNSGEFCDLLRNQKYNKMKKLAKKFVKTEGTLVHASF